MNQVKIGIIGMGNMGSSHAKNIFDGHIKGAVLTAICDERPDRIQWVEDIFGNQVQSFSSYDDFFSNADIDGVIIATPHYDHPSLAIKAFNRGLHVLCEKPAGVYTKKCKRNE